MTGHDVGVGLVSACAAALLALRHPAVAYARNGPTRQSEIMERSWSR